MLGTQRAKGNMTRPLLSPEKTRDFSKGREAGLRCHKPSRGFTILSQFGIVTTHRKRCRVPLGAERVQGQRQMAGRSYWRHCTEPALKTWRFQKWNDITLEDQVKNLPAPPNIYLLFLKCK